MVVKHLIDLLENQIPNDSVNQVISSWYVDFIFKEKRRTNK